MTHAISNGKYGKSEKAAGKNRKTPHKLVLDANVLLSGFLFDGNERQLLMDVGRGNHKLFISGDLFSEFLEVIGRPKFGLSPEKQDEIASSLMEITELVETLVKVKVVKEDPDDDAVLECALSAKADYIISGDKHLLSLKNFRGIPICNARSFLGK